MAETPLVEGHVVSGFEQCRDAFAAVLRSGAETGAACTIRVDGRTVVDLWGGLADGATGRPWQRGTIVPVFSVSKGVAAICVLHLASQGLVELDAPIARYWPEFGAAGKDAVSVRDVLAHRAGVPFVDGEVTMDQLADVAGMAARLAEQAPLFEPGTAHLYHPVTIGWITSELFRRVTGSTLGEWFSSEVAGPLDLALYFGLPAEERGRAARLAYRDPEGAAAAMSLLMADGSVPWQALTLNGLLSFAHPLGDRSLNDPRVQAVELAGAGLIADARSLAMFYGACIAPIGGIRLLSDETIKNAIAPVSTGKQFGLDEDGPAWAAGIMIPWSVQPMLSASSFGHDGMGGSLAFADPQHRVAFAYVRNGIATGGVKDPEVYAVVDALRSVLDVAA